MRKRKEGISLSKADIEFFQGFYEQYKRLLYHEARAYTSGEAQRDDLIQDALLRLMKNIPVLRGLTHRKAAYYVVITVRTTYIDTLRQQSGAVLPLEDEEVAKMVYSRALAQRQEPDLSAKLAVRQLRESLPEREWFVLVGKFILGYTHEELSTLMGLEPANVRMILSRAKAKARKLLQEADWIGGDGA